MFKSIFIIIAVGAISFYYTDLNSTSKFYSSILPLVDFIAMVALAIWFVVLFYLQGVNQTTGSGNLDTNAFVGFGGYDGGEGGGC